MLEDFSLFVRSRAYALELSMIVIWHDSTTGKIFEEIEEERSRILSTWDAVGDGDYDIDHIDQNLKLLQQSHQNYQKLYCDQQERKPVMLLSEILKRLNNLQQISIDDSVQEEGHVDEKGHLVLAWESGYIPASMWSGSEFGPNIATPWKLIADIFDTMEMLSVHPAKFCLDIYEAIFDPRAFQMSPECLVRIGDILKDTKSIRVHIEQAYKDRDDIEDDIESVGLLTNALCNVASLQELELSFLCIDGYRPAAFVLPLGKTTWVHLRTLKLRRIAFTREKFRMLLQQCNKDVLEDVHLHDVESPSMSRQDVSEDLKSFTKVRKIIWRDA
ncbi:hypothetical protein DTO280E4_7682 [Paecilomyces variotii]|nr:hypothetical protein DTO280E4_7682 [Paecilomyces variotii]